MAVLDDVGLIEALTMAIGEQDSEIGGLRMTRTTAVVNATVTTIPVETTLNWPDTGKIAMDGIPYFYTGKTNTSFTGITHIAGGASVNGAVIQHRTNSTVVDIAKERSALDQLRRALLVDYAEDEDLNALARNLGVERVPMFSGDDQFRAVVKLVAYNPKGTLHGIELVMDALIGVGNYTIYEDLVNIPCTVFILVDIGAIIGAASAGKSFMTGPGWDQVYGSQDTLALAAEPLAISGVRLKTIDELFDFRDDKPSAVTYPYWPGETPAAAFVYTGVGSEATFVTQVPDSYTKFKSLDGSTVHYTMYDLNGSHIIPESYVEFSLTMLIPTGSVLTGTVNQVGAVLHDSAWRHWWGVDQDTASTFECGVFSTTGGGFIGTTVILNRDEWHTITYKKYGTSHIELWANGQFVTRVPYSQLGAVTAVHRIVFGLHGGTSTNTEAWFKQVGIKIKSSKDYWASRGIAGTTNVANPTRFATGGGSDFISGDVGKTLIITEATAPNPQGGNANGIYKIASFVGGPPTGIVELEGLEHTDSAQVSDTDRITMNDERFFTYPDDLGKEIVISGSLLGNDGTYVIDKLMVFQSPSTYIELGTGNFQSPGLTVRTGICEVVTATFTPEVDLEIQLIPDFVTDSALGWELSDAGSFSGTTITLRQAVWLNGLIMEVHFSDVLTAQVMAITQILNEVIATGPPVLYEYYPFYVADPLGAIKAYIDTITAAGVIPEFFLD